MTANKKEWLENRSEEIAQEVYGQDFYALGPHIQLLCYMKAREDWKDYYASLIDAAYEREKERQLLG